MWRAKLPTRVNLMKKNVITNNLCPMCQMEIESNGHALWRPAASTIWSLAPKNWTIENRNEWQNGQIKGGGTLQPVLLGGKIEISLKFNLKAANTTLYRKHQKKKNSRQISFSMIWEAHFGSSIFLSPK